MAKMTSETKTLLFMVAVFIILMVAVPLIDVIWAD
jgi:hypothetical protein